jgi:hypothetical protein
VNALFGANYLESVESFHVTSPPTKDEFQVLEHLYAFQNKITIERVGEFDLCRVCYILVLYGDLVSQFGIS